MTTEEKLEKNGIKNSKLSKKTEVLKGGNLKK